MTLTRVFAELSLQPPGIGWLGSLALAIGVAAAVFAYTAGLIRPRDAPPARIGLLCLRLGAITCAFLALWHPEWVRTIRITEQPTIAIVLDDSASMDQPAGEGSPTTRYDHAVSVVSKRIRPALRDTHELELYNAQAQPLEFADLPASPETIESPLIDSLLRLQEEQRERELAGIVLLSDGRQASTRRITGEPGQLRLPVHVIRVVDEPTASDSANVAIHAVAANRHALVGNTVRVGVDLSARGVDEKTRIPVSVIGNNRTLARRTVDRPAGATTVRAELEFTPQRAGEQTYLIQAGPLPGERGLSDNRRAFPLSVRARPLTVVYVDGVLRWEGKFLREALATDPDLNVVSTTRTAPPGTDRGSQGLLLPDQLANVDVVILGDVEAGFFSAAELSALRTWVTDAGGAVLLTGGYRSFGPEGLGRTVLREVLPVEFSAAANPQVDTRFNLQLTDAGREHPAFRLTGDRERDVAFFHSLPPLDGCSRVAGVKAGAEVLAVNPRGARGGGPGGLPVMVVQDVGAGRAMVFAVDTTWKWRMVVGGFTGDSEFYPRFWGQLVRWLATDDRSVSPRLVVSPDRTRYRSGQTIELSIELAQPHDAGSAGAADLPRYEITATALSESGDKRSIPLTEITETSYRGTFPAREAGRLDVMVHAESLTAGDSAASALSSIATVEIEHSDPETGDTRPDPQWLARVAQQSGGQILEPNEINEWAATLPAEGRIREETRASGLAGDRTLGAIFLALLCTEWVLRKRSRLA
jgi:uncharacterized membrane protein